MSVRPVERSSVGSESEGSSSDEETGRFKVKSAVVQVSAEGTHILHIHILHFFLSVGWKERFSRLLSVPYPLPTST